MSQAEQSQAASVSDGAFFREMLRHSEQGRPTGVREVNQLWKYSKGSEGYMKSEGALSVHEIEALAKKTDGDLMAFARAVERAALIKAYTLLPEIRQAEKAKHHRRHFRDGLYYGLAIYSGAIRILTMGQIPGETVDEGVKPAPPRRAREIEKMEISADAEGVRPGFEAWAGRRQFDLRRESGSYANHATGCAWMGWLSAKEETPNLGGPDA
jgi:hypothetical protein